MNWETFYLICFVVGFAYTAFSFLSGTLHFHLHVPHHFHGGHGAGHSGGGIASLQLRHFQSHDHLRFSGMVRRHGIPAGPSAPHMGARRPGAFHLSGVIGAGIVFVFAAKYFMAHESSLDPMDFEMVGVLGHVSGSIRGRGTGEIIFVQEGARKACAARSEEGEEIRRGEEVVVTRFDQGVAYVRRWSELAEKAGVMPAEEGKSL